MLRFLKNIFGVSFLLTALVSAQTPQSTHGAAIHDSPQSPPGITLRANAKIVVVNVTVTARNGAPVHDLKRENFTIFENGKPQTVSSFEEHSALKDGEALKFSPSPSMPPGVFTNIPLAPVNSAVNILLIDFLNTPYEDQAYMRAQLTDYITHARPGTSIAIFTLNNSLHMLQGFTSDPEVLKQALNNLAGRPSAVKGMGQAGGNIASYVPMVENVPSGSFNGNVQGLSIASAAQPPAIATAIQSLQQAIQGNPQVYQGQRLTLDAFNVLARYLANIPGRKNLVWFSGSFPITMLPNNAISPTGAINDSLQGGVFSPNSGAIPVTDSFASTNIEPEFRRTTDLLARSQVAVYPVDARGVVDSPGLRPDSGLSIVNSNPATINSDKSSFDQSLAAEHSTMETLAFSTGGRPFINDNELSKAVSRAISIGSNYYTLYYTPANGDWNGDFRKIEVKLSRAGYNLSYRRGYFANDFEQPMDLTVGSATTQTANAKASANARLVRSTMVHGAPEATEILYKVRVLPTADTEETIAEGNVLTPLGQKKSADKLRRYVVDFDVDAKDMLFPPRPEGGYDCKVEFVVQVYQDDGQLVNTASNALVANLTLAQRNKLIRGGFPFHEEISVPLNGNYSLRIGVHDFNSDRIGAVELPVASLKDLPPAETPATARLAAAPPGAAK
jgi:VWFA-related protein